MTCRARSRSNHNRSRSSLRSGLGSFLIRFYRPQTFWFTGTTTDLTICSNHRSATHVPVGEDQAQHLEFTRNCAVSFNAQFRGEAGENILTIPETMLCMNIGLARTA